MAIPQGDITTSEILVPEVELAEAVLELDDEKLVKVIEEIVQEETEADEDN